MNDADPFLRRIRNELSASFAPDVAVSHAAAADPIDVIGGFCDYAGATVLSTTNHRQARVAVQTRDDEQVHVFSFDLYDAHRPFTVVAPLEAIRRASDDQLKVHFADANTAWAGVAIATIRAAIKSGSLPATGIRIAIQSDASRPATMLAAVASAIEPLSNSALPVASLAERVADASGQAIRARDVLTCLHATPGTLVRVKCQPCELLGSVEMPEGVTLTTRDVACESDDWKSVSTRIRVASAMGRRLIVEKIRQMGIAAGREMVGDPTGGYLSNIALNDYRRYFRPYLPESLKGGTFLLEHRRINDPTLHIHPDTHYPIQAACDLHIFSANRVATFVDCLNAARATSDAGERQKELNKAGHLLYATHAALAGDAGLVCLEADAIVEHIRKHEHAGYFGAGLTPSGVVILQDVDAKPI